MLSLEESDRPIVALKIDYPIKKLEIVYFHEPNNNNNNNIDDFEQQFDKAVIKPNIRRNRADYLNYSDFDIDGRAMPSEYMSRMDADIKRGGNIFRPIDTRYEQYINTLNQRIDDRMKKSLVANNGEFQILPRQEENQVDIILCSGCSGSGKSTWTGKFAQAYHLLFPKNRIILISKKDEDEEFDKLKYVKRLGVDESLLEDEPLDTHHFENSLVIFDDIENINPPELRKEVYRIKDLLIETGRSKNISVCLCTHISMNGKETRKDLNESNWIVIFPHNSSPYHMTQLLEKYGGFDKKQIKQMSNEPSRWLAIHKHAPRFYVTEHKVQLI